MAKRKNRTPAPEPTPKDFPRASPESEARFPKHLSPIIQCKTSVLDRARIEFYAALIVGAVEVLLPVSAITRSIILLFVFGPLIDIVWRSPWSHAQKRFLKVSLTFLLVIVYAGIVATLFIREHETAALALQQYLESGRGEWLVRWGYAFVAALITYAGLKVSRMIRDHLREARADELAIQKKFYDSTPKGWLDHRFESKKSSAHLHFLVARMQRRVKAMALIMRVFPWIVDKDDKRPPADRARIAASFLAFACEAYSRKIEPEA